MGARAGGAQAGGRARRSTATSSFGVGRRESHDAQAFYQRFSSPAVSDDDAVEASPVDELFVWGDAREMGEELPDGSVALVVTSPPYFAGKDYELALGRGTVPASYLDYLAMLEAVFRRCVDKLEPGGRMAVNVANLGRRPYRSLSADVIRILQDDLHLLLRGEVIWVKGRGQSGSCAWGTFASATNPVLRDVSERVVVASKGRFDRARRPERRALEGLPHESTTSRDEFMEATLDVWEIPPESARRVGHPAPFPVALPQRLIELYTYRHDLVLDPFLGAGSTAVAAVRTGRRCAGYDTDERYVQRTRERVAEERARLAGPSGHDGTTAGVANQLAAAAGDFRASATAEGKAAKAIAAKVLEAAGFRIVHRERRFPRLGMTVGLVAHDAADEPWYFDVTGAFTATQGGLVRSDTLWKTLGGCVLARDGIGPLVLLTSHLPPRRHGGDRALRTAGIDLCFDALEMLSPTDRARLARYAAGGARRRPLPGFWSDAEIMAHGATGRSASPPGP